MRVLSTIVAVLLVTSLVPPAAVGTADDGPLADAGLDQQVTQGSTVYLDGGGSYAPDGEIVSYEWTIQTPGDETIEPEEPTAVTTTFEASELGRYEVTLRVTDDEGRSNEDTLYVDVEPGTGPSIALDGPESTIPGESLTYTASVSAGDAPLETVIWRVDGEKVDRTGGEAGTVERVHQFDTLGDKDVSVTVVDEAGNQDTASLDVSVSEPDETGGSDDSDWYTGIADRDDPSVHGPQYVDGEKPLDATYGISSDYAGSIQSVTWRVDGNTAGSGGSFGVTWEPGYHTLSALVEYEDGSKTIATFDDGGREVLANPKPVVHIDDLSGFGESIGGTAVASDELGLKLIEVEVDGDPVETWADPSGMELQQAVEFAHDVSGSGETREVRVVATDKYGQTATVSEEVDVVGKPSIVSAEFLNDPVDSYHERIDEERYAAELEIVVNIRNIKPDNIEIKFGLDQGVQKISDEDIKYDKNNGELIIRSEFAGFNPGEYDIKSEIIVEDYDHHVIVKNTFVVEESPPEARLNIHVIDEKNPHTRRIHLDAGDSFDPDGSKLAYTWNPDKYKSSVNHQSTNMSIDGMIDLVVVDSQNNTDRINRPAYEFYSPKLKNASINNELYNPDESVKIETVFEWHDTSDESFHYTDIVLQVIESTGQVISLGREPGSDANQTFRIVGTVELPAAEFLGGETPKIKIYNEKNPDQTERIYELPTPEFENLHEPFKRNAELAETRYLVEEPIYDDVAVDSKHEVDILEADGYYVYKTTTDVQYHVEKLHVQEAQYETKQESFESQQARSQFLKMTQGWKPAGAETTTETQTTTETEWRKTKGGQGEFTGTTRTVQTQSPTYRTEYQYSSVYGGTYWSTNAFHPRDQKTGATRQVKVRSAKYETEYQYEVEQTETVTETTYFAEKHVQTQPRIEEWRHYETTTSETYAEQLAQADNLRIGESDVDETWHLRKQTDLNREEVSEVEDGERVVETRGIIEGEMAEYYVDEEKAEVGIRKTGVFEEHILMDGYVDESKLMEKYHESTGDRDDCENGNSKECAL